MVAFAEGVCMEEEVHSSESRRASRKESKVGEAHLILPQMKNWSTCCDERNQLLGRSDFIDSIERLRWTQMRTLYICCLPGKRGFTMSSRSLVPGTIFSSTIMAMW